MYRLNIAQLAEIVDGQVVLGLMPPLAGLFEPIGRMVVDCCELRPRDVFWGIASNAYDGTRNVDEAFSRGALGVVIAGRRMEPWAGRFCVQVADTTKALQRMLRCLSRGEREQSPPWYSDDELTLRVIEAVRRGDELALAECTQSLGRRMAASA